MYACSGRGSKKTVNVAATVENAILHFQVSSACMHAMHTVNIIGASLSEPHINGTAMRAIYGICIYVYMYVYIYVYNMYICMVRPSHSVYMYILI